MKNQFKLQIENPCSENFNQFTPTSEGGFCGSCEKNVVDFTVMSRSQISNYFKNHSESYTCGRFHASQLTTYTTAAQQQRNRFALFGGLAIAAMALLTTNTVSAQTPPQQQTEVRVTENYVQTVTQQETFIIKGVVQESNLPLPGANIVLQGTTVGTTTDFDGQFEFPQPLKKGDVLLVSYVGMETKKITISDVNSASNVPLQVSMVADHHVLMGKVAVKKVHKSNRSFWNK